LFAPSFCAGQDVKDLSPQLSSAITKSGRKTVAVVDFTDLQGCVTEFGRFLAEEFSVALATGSGGFEVIDRTNLKTLLQEHKLAATGIIDPQTARKVGEIAGVQALVTGTVTPLGDSVRLSVKVLDAQSAKIVGGVSADMPRNKAIDELLRKGISSGCISSSEVKTEPHTEQNVPQSASVEIKPFLFLFQGCRKTESEVECYGNVSNKTERDQRLSIWTSNRTYLVDNTGQQSKDVSARIGTSEEVVDLPPGVPVNFTISARGLSGAATSVSIYLVTSYGSGTVRDFRLKDK
jgi:TolB-like protein